MLNHNDYQKINELGKNNPEIYELFHKIEDYALESASHGCHDLRNHAALISSYCQLLSMTTPAIAQNPYFQKIELSTKNLISLFDEIGIFRYSFKNGEQHAANLKELLENSIQQVKTQFAAMPVQISVQDNITSDDCLFTCDASHMANAFKAILTNSIEACKPDDIQIFLSMSHLDQSIQIQFQDNGCGFSEEMLTEACKPFVTEKKEHAGLGLAIASTVIHKHNGSLMISNTDNGSCVTILLPL